jgi:hypothetical protein
VNDHDAMTAINKVLDEVFAATISNYDALRQIAQISGENAIDHEAAK